MAGDQGTNMQNMNTSSLNILVMEHNQTAGENLKSLDLADKLARRARTRKRKTAMNEADTHEDDEDQEFGKKSGQIRDCNNVDLLDSEVDHG